MRVDPRFLLILTRRIASRFGFTQITARSNSKDAALGASFSA
jgi:hypothetical protein